MATNKDVINEPDSNSGVSSEAICLPDFDAGIAELAYYKAERRGFEPGRELEDWLEAEQEFKL